MKYILMIVTLILVSPTMSLAQEFDVGAVAHQEVWPTRHQGFQNQTFVEVNGELKWEHFSITGWTNFVYWTNDNSNIAGSFLNAESGKFLEKNYGGTFTLDLFNCSIGAWAGRRAFLELGVDDKWGDADQYIESGPPYPTIGYHDEVRPHARCDFNVFGFAYSGPKLVRWNNDTNPWHQHLIDVNFKFDKILCSSRIELGGNRGEAFGNAYDFFCGYPISDHFTVGAVGGTLAHPGFGKPVQRGGLVLKYSTR